MSDKKSESGEYWDKHVVSWEASTYFTDKNMPKPNLWDRFSTYFRGSSLYDRMTIALDLLKPHLNGLTVLDVGCASGRFANLLLEAGAARVVGVIFQRISSRSPTSGDSRVRTRTAWNFSPPIWPNPPTSRAWTS